MTRFRYNDIDFLVEANGPAWDLIRLGAEGARAVVGSALFAGASAEEASARAQALARAIHPVGVKIVGPDVAHPQRIGDLKIVGPDVTHPNFIRWEKDSVSFPAQP